MFRERTYQTNRKYYYALQAERLKVSCSNFWPFQNPDPSLFCLTWYKSWPVADSEKTFPDIIFTGDKGLLCFAFSFWVENEKSYSVSG